MLQAQAIDVCQIDSCRLAGVSEVLSVLFMAAKFGVPVMGLSEYAIHLRYVLCASSLPKRSIYRSLIDYIAVSGSIDIDVLEYICPRHVRRPVSPL